MHGHGLVAMHPAHLCFAKIGRDPNAVERYDGEQLLARLHPLTHLNGFVPDHSRGRRDNMRVAQIKPGLIERGLGSLHGRLSLANHLAPRPNRRAVRVDGAASTFPTLTISSSLSRAITF